jgi:hypothetical protein
MLFVAYECLSDSELIRELDMINRLVETLSSQAEKLVKLRAEGKVGESAYFDVLEELRKRAIFTYYKKDELLSAADYKIKQIDSKIAQFSHDLELLKVRHAIGEIPNSKYNVFQEGIGIQLGEIEETRNRIVELKNKIIGNSERIDIVGMPAQPSVARLRPDYLVDTTKSFAKSNNKPIEMHSETSKQKVKCSKCGVENVENASYCYNCGTKIEKDKKAR